MTTTAGISGFIIGDHNVDVDADSVKTHDGKKQNEDIVAHGGKVGKKKIPQAAMIEATVFIPDELSKDDLMISGKDVQVVYENGSTETLKTNVDYVGERQVDRSNNSFAAKWSGKFLIEVKA